MCLRPLHYFESDLADETGKKYGFITGYQVKEADYNTFLLHKVPCTLGFRCKPLVVPCGKCAECKQANRNKWVGRCIAELETCSNAYFVTLTFDNEHLKDCEKSDVQKFIKRFRKRFDCRYMAVGEYGSLSNRPHFHLILFMNESLTDLRLFKRSNMPLYRSDFIEQCWPFGLSSVGEANARSIAYTIGYLVKEEKKTAFKLQSQGLGSKFFSDLKERYILPTGCGSEMVVYLPRYLKKKYGIDFDFDKGLSEMIFKNKLFNSGLSEFDYRNFAEYLANSKLHV